MINPFRRRRWPRGDWLALAEAFAVLALVRVSLAVLGFKRVERLAGRLARGLAPSPVAGSPDQDARLGRAVRRAGVLVPGARCLAQAFAGMILAARTGQRSRMTIGVALGSQEAFGAHAWLETAHGIPVGGDEAAAFAPLMTVDPFSDARGPR